MRTFAESIAHTFICRASVSKRIMLRESGMSPKLLRIGCEMQLSLFFFSSRRRHTRFDCDWSSDVCSSDLLRRGAGMASRLQARRERVERQLREHAAWLRKRGSLVEKEIASGRKAWCLRYKIGRASCRERV